MADRRLRVDITAKSRPPIAEGAVTWAAYLATGNPVVLTAATRAELADALRLARDEVLRLRGPLA